MTTSPSSIPVSVDYTSRDYYALREALIARVKARVEAANPNRQWEGNDPSDFGVALVEAFSYMGDVIGYYIDRVANESYLLTATQRQNVINIARSYGYSPSGYQAAITTLSFTNLTASSVTIPQGTQVYGEVLIDDVVTQIIFTTLEELVLSANETDTVDATHGELISVRTENVAEAGVIIGNSDGSPSQVFELDDTTIVEDSIRVFVQSGAEYQEWTKVDNLIDYGPTDLVFEVLIDANNVHYVVFGDGVSGSIPNTLSNIKVDYVIGGGVIGNIAPNVISDVYAVPGFTENETALLANKLTVTNATAGLGGDDPEATDQIRRLAPLALTALNRAVSLVDYENLVLNLATVGKAKAVADTRTSVILYIAPQSSSSETDLYPGIDYIADPTLETPTLEWYNLEEAVIEFLENRTQLGISVTIAPPSYVPVTVQVTYTKLANYSASQIETQIKNRILEIYSYGNISFGDVIRPEEIEYELLKLQPVTSIKVTALHRTDATPGRNVLIAEPSEVFVFGDLDPLVESIVVTPASTDASLTTLVASVGTLSPIFATGTLSYTLTVPNGTTATTITATPTNAGATVYINGVLSGGSGTAITTAVGITTVNVNVFAASISDTKTYTIGIVRTS
jgi:hypothetical protein